MLDESGFVDKLVAGFEREPQGLKTNVEMIRLLFIGTLLAISETKSATIASAYEALLTKVDFRDQMRLGIRTGEGPKDFIKCDRLYYASYLIADKLSYGKSTEGLITRYESARRHDAVLDACSAILDYTAEATEVDDTELAIDQTAVWAWSVGKFCPKPTIEEIEDQSDEMTKEGLSALRGGDVNIADLGEMKVTDDPKKLKGFDPDAAWSGATAKDGGLKRFYGYFASVIAAVPRGRIDDDPTTRAPIVRRVEMTSSTDDVVDVTLRLLDSIPNKIKSILVDRHYSFKKFERWQLPLIKRNIRQVFDLRADDYKVLNYDEAIYVGGSGHCPAMPLHYTDDRRPGVFATREEHEAFQGKMESRYQYAHVVINQLDEKGSMKLRCPAREFKVACPLFPPSMEVAAELGLTTINTDLLGLEPGQELPRCCTQDSFRVTVPEAAAKLNQINYWGSKSWYRAFAGRASVEGVFGNLKNPRTENLKRGTIQKTGLVWVQLIVTLICATYNVRVIRNRHDRLEFDPIDHPLLSKDEETVTHVSLTAEQEMQIFRAYQNGEDIESLLIEVLGTLPDEIETPDHKGSRPHKRRRSRAMEANNAVAVAK